MRWTALLMVLCLPLASFAGEPRRGDYYSHRNECCLFGCRCGDRDSAQTNALLMQILSNQQQIIALLTRDARPAFPIQSQPPVVINMPAPRGDLAPGAPKGEIPGGAPKGDIPGGPPKGDIPGGQPKGEIPGGAPRGDIPTMPMPTPPAVPGVRETPGGDLPSTPPATVTYQQFSVGPRRYSDADWKPARK